MARLKMLKPRVATLAKINNIGTIQATPRMQGQGAVDRRLDWLKRYPLCVMCQEETPPRVTLGDVVDHKTPLWKGGADDYESNGQTLCQEHHDIKTAAEQRERFGYGAHY